MTRSAEERARDVLRLVEAARTVAGEAPERSALVRDLVRSTGLSREGVALGLIGHLELTPTDAEIASLVESAGDAESVVVLLSANVFVAALRAVAIARACASRVVMRPSRREPFFARALVAAAQDPGLTCVDEVDLGRVAGGEVHVYGRDQTIADVRRAVRDPRVRVKGHGAGMGIALVSRAATLDEAADALAADVIAFDQRGCLSPRIALVEGERAEAFADALDTSLVRAAARVPRGALANDERAAAARWLATMGFAGRAIERQSHAVAVARAGASLLVPPPGRHVHIVPFATLDDARALLAAVTPVVVAVGSDDIARFGSIVPSHARTSALGAMQRPLFDGPVDRRTPT